MEFITLFVLLKIFNKDITVISSNFTLVKKIAIILLLFIYGFTTIGATVNVHYCMKKIVGWEIGRHNENEKCGKCGMTESKTKKGCCKDEVKQVKLNGDYHKSTISNLSKVNFALYIVPTKEIGRAHV